MSDAEKQLDADYGSLRKKEAMQIPLEPMPVAESNAKGCESDRFIEMISWTLRTIIARAEALYKDVSGFKLEASAADPQVFYLTFYRAWTEKEKWDAEEDRKKRSAEYDLYLKLKAKYERSATCWDDLVMHTDAELEEMHGQGKSPSTRMYGKKQEKSKS